MALKAVIFDYGKVLSGPPDPEAWAALLRITGIPPVEFERVYWEHRPHYDTARFNGSAYWQQIARDTGIVLSDPTIEELIGLDASVWTTANPAMIEWSREVRRHGIKTAILSNMCGHVYDRMVSVFGWLDEFDVTVWSHLLGIAKPDEAIYRNVLAKLKLDPIETLFLDDKAPNVAAARAIGMNAHIFTTAENLRAWLLAEGLDRELPLPV